MAHTELRAAGTGLLLLVLTLSPTAGLAQSACTLPVQPVCSTGVTGTESGSGKLRCESDVTKYIQDLETYRGCLDAANATAREKVERAKQFRDCLAGGRDDCTLDMRR